MNRKYRKRNIPLLAAISKWSVNKHRVGWNQPFGRHFQSHKAVSIFSVCEYYWVRIRPFSVFYWSNWTYLICFGKWRR